jgi:hypothetical protein
MDISSLASYLELCPHYLERPVARKSLLSSAANPPLSNPGLPPEGCSDTARISQTAAAFPQRFQPIHLVHPAGEFIMARVLDSEDGRGESQKQVK